MNLSYKRIILTIALLLSTTCAVAHGASPARYFDLSHWYLTLPDTQHSTISPKQLQAGYHSHYFYVGPNHTMAFWCKPGGTTLHTHYSRTELRERLDPTSDSKNWRVNVGTHVLTARLKVEASTTAPKIVVLQIHAYGDHVYAPPLLKILWEKHSGQLAAEYKTDSTGQVQKKIILGKPGNQIFSCRIIVSHNRLKVYYNHQLKFKRTINYWDKYTNYFKAGNYLQTINPKQSGLVLFYSLSHTHS